MRLRRARSRPAVSPHRSRSAARRTRGNPHEHVSYFDVRRRVSRGRESVRNNVRMHDPRFKCLTVAADPIQVPALATFK